MAVYSDEKIEFFNRASRNSDYKMFDYHYHNKHELYFLEKGKTQYFIGSEIYFLTAGNMVFIPKGEFHKTNLGEKDFTERLLLVFDNDFLGEDFIPYINELSHNKLILIPPEKLYKIKEIYEKIEHEDKHKGINYLEMEKLYLKQLLILIKRYHIKNNTLDLSESHKIIQNCATYICENYHLDLNLDSLAEKYSLSKSYFSKLFKQVTGVGINEYITTTRISAAQNLLSKNNLSITEVATRCGFNDSNYFAAVFKKIKGITPKKYSLINK